MKHIVKPAGTVIVMDERAGEHFTGEPDPVEEMMYGFSLISCLPTDATPPSRWRRAPSCARHSNGTQPTPDSSIDVLPIDNDFFRFYNLSL
ncbi:MAG: hypothetical protein R2714_02790 [Microthrixaceae bacterium]